MKASSIITAVFPQLSFAAAVLARNSTACTDPAVRVEWRTLTTVERAEYITAVKCLATKPSILGLNSTLYDDFPWVHSQLNLDIHFVAQFLPWHRVFLQQYENALRSACGYSGLMPYWDWTQDAYRLPYSPLLDPSPNATAFSFGGNGAGECGFVPPTRPNPLLCCITSGPFVDLRPKYFNNYEQPHCLNRFFSNITQNDGWNGQAYAPEMIANITANNTKFETFWQALESTPHGAVHGSLGGDMVPQTSPNDPLFFMHHAQVDRLWWLWQQADPTARILDYSGNKFAAYTGDDTRASLDDIMTFKGLNPNITVQSAMSTDSSDLCYRYA
ncbi:hypothetical protein JX265_012423 [Neoarthrinium moseri]|uniref:Tyrosinase copper-binding domain-containing protein n=1 Tax=Neoarthrinium moseri TaxID=1658444 RepID=A0A9P9WAQ4_9PEZI|nr:hypothetical protein JX266_008336 [Neoarthrinium moseri]KAI1854389.1 hypothetical protein JX265_012423 [Neoarthrinium moseri]